MIHLFEASLLLDVYAIVHLTLYIGYNVKIKMSIHKREFSSTPLYLKSLSTLKDQPEIPQCTASCNEINELIQISWAGFSTQGLLRNILFCLETACPIMKN
jgi:hypothetical protein